MSTPTILFTDNDYEDSFDWVYHEKKIISSRYIDLIDNYIADHEELIHPAGIGGGDNMVEEVIRRADVMWMLNQDDSIPSELIPLYKEISRGVHSIIRGIGDILLEDWKHCSILDIEQKKEGIMIGIKILVLVVLLGEM